MRRFTPFIVVGIILLFFMVIGLIFDKPNGSFSIWNQIQPPQKNTFSAIKTLPQPQDPAGGGNHLFVMMGKYNLNILI